MNDTHTPKPPSFPSYGVEVEAVTVANETGRWKHGQYGWYRASEWGKREYPHSHIASWRYLPEASCSRLVWKRCHGPAIQAGSEKCAASTADSSGGHMVPNAGDAASYNGVRTWRCPRCFEEHRRRIATAKSPDAPLLALRAWEQASRAGKC
jgi:hypothetical protein